MSAGKRLRPGARTAAGGSKSRKRRRPNPSGPEGSGVKDPVAAFHALLENQRLAADSVQALSDGQRERRWMIGERPLCAATRPQLSTSRRAEQDAAAAEGVASH